MKCTERKFEHSVARMRNNVLKWEKGDVFFGNKQWCVVDSSLAFWVKSGHFKSISHSSALFDWFFSLVARYPLSLVARAPGAHWLHSTTSRFPWSNDSNYSIHLTNLKILNHNCGFDTKRTRSISNATNSADRNEKISHFSMKL